MHERVHIFQTFFEQFWYLNKIKTLLAILFVDYIGLILVGIRLDNKNVVFDPIHYQTKLRGLKDTLQALMDFVD